MSAVRTLALGCRSWPCVAGGLDPGRAAVVVHANRVLDATPAARAEGVEVGQRRREAQARCPDLTVVERDIETEVRVFDRVVATLDDTVARVELAEPGSVSFPTRGPSRYFGGDEALASRVASAAGTVLAELGWESAGALGVGVADGPFAAHLAARTATAERAGLEVVPPGGSPAFLAPLPIGVLGRDELAEVLVRLGIRTLGDLAALPASDVLGRFGSDGALAHRLASGLDERPPATAAPPPELSVEVDIDPPAERVDRVAFAGKALADELHGRLEALGMSCSRVLVVAESDHGEVRERLWRHEGALGPVDVADRVRWQLDGWLNGPASARPSAGISRICLRADEVGPAKGRQLGFWGGEGAAAERVARAVARVVGMLGPGSVRVPELRGGRGPMEAVALVPFPGSGVSVPPSRSGVSGGRRGSPGHAGSRSEEHPWPGRVPEPHPALVHPEPVPVEVVDAAGEGVVVSGRGEPSSAPSVLSIRGGPWQEVLAWAGPWLAEERWWDSSSARRRARFQVLVEGGAFLLAVESGRWWLEATYA